MTKNGPLQRKKGTENAPNSKDKGPASTTKKDPFSMEKGKDPKKRTPGVGKK